MLKLGEFQNLYIGHRCDYGIMLTDGESEVLLPNNEVCDIKGEKEVSVFIYKDSLDRIIATRSKPYITIGQVKKLRVVDITKIGAFLDWGLKKDLFLPFKEQTTKLRVGSSYLVCLYIDKSNRLCATMKLYNCLKKETQGKYKIDDIVEAYVFDKSDKYGLFAAVNYKYLALIPKRELYKDIEIADEIEARITDINNEGKITLALRDKIPVQINKDADAIFQLLKTGGFLGLNDKSKVEDIYKKTKLSKNAFKRAVGKLYKDRKIVFINNGIDLLNR